MNSEEIWEVNGRQFDSKTAAEEYADTVEAAGEVVTARLLPLKSEANGIDRARACPIRPQNGCGDSACNTETTKIYSMTLPGFYPSGVKPARDHRDFIAFSNGILDVRRLLAGDPYYLQPLTPEWFSNIRMDYAFDPLVDCPRWKNVLGENLEWDGERIALLQEWLGYLLLPDTRHQKFLVLEGEGANGKSVYCAAVQAVLGNEAVSHIPLEIFGQRFALTETVGRLVNIAADCGDIDRVSEGHLKSFTSGDRMFFDRKGLPGISSAPTARMMLATNNRPRFSDRSGGIWRRMLIVPFRVTVPEERQVLGMDKPEWWRASSELPGIFNWALVGLHRLRENRHFTVPEICRDALSDYRIEVNPARGFLEEMCSEEPLDSIAAHDLYKGYKEWCSENGYRPLGEKQFGKEVRRKYPKALRVRLGERGDRQWTYRGITYHAPTI